MVVPAPIWSTAAPATTSSTGSAGRDTIRGGPGADYVDARDGGPDLLDGGPGIDRGLGDRKLDRLIAIEKKK